MLFNVLFLIASRIFLSNQIISGLAKNNKLPKSEGSWFYVKCSKNQNCNSILNSLENKTSRNNISLIKNNQFLVYLNHENYNLLSKLDLKFKKLTKEEKFIEHDEDDNERNTYIIYSSIGCNIPFLSINTSSNYFVFQTNMEQKIVKKALSKIKCIRSFELLSSPTLQSEEITDINLKTQILFVSSPLHQKLLNHGLGGNGQIVSIVDSGIDTDLCWFKDPEKPIKYSKVLTHRKILAYFSYGDEQDTLSGHGTFISGIIAGNAICDELNNDKCNGNYYNGIVPHAKIIMNDIYKGNDLILPSNLTDLFLTPLNLGACVQYHGFSNNINSLFSSFVDSFAYKYPQMLLIFPEEPKGNIYSKRKVSNDIIYPSSKNVLIVGFNSVDSLIANEINPHSPIVVINNNNTYMGFCDTFHGISFFHYLLRKGILNSTSHQYILGEGASLGFPGSDKSCEIVLLFNINEEINAKYDYPVIILPETAEADFQIGDEIEIKLFEDYNSYHNERTYHEREKEKKNFINKPDLYLSGGPAYGPNSGTNVCGYGGIRYGEGSSVSAAFATGDLVLLSQYLSEGFYITNKTYKPTSHMLRAIISNIEDDSKTSHLEKFCIFKDDYYLNNNETIKYGIRFYTNTLESFASNCYIFTSQYDGFLKVTVTWLDPPHDPFAPANSLFKIEARIECENGTVLGDISFDHFNTLKNYMIPVKANEIFKIFIICGDNLFFNKADYTVVISGPFDHFNNSCVYQVNNSENIEPKCIQKCDPGSKCINGYCVCPKEKYGEDCSKSIIPITNHKLYKNNEIRPHDSLYFSYIFKNWKPGAKLLIEFNETLNHFYFMFSINNVPTWDSANCNSENCQWITKEEKTVIIEYNFWDFVLNNDCLYFVIYSITDHTLHFDVTFTLHSS